MSTRVRIDNTVVLKPHFGPQYWIMCRCSILKKTYTFYEGWSR